MKPPRTELENMMMLFKKIRLLDSDDELLEQVAVLLANAGRQYRMLPVVAIAVALGSPPSTISRCLRSLRECGLATAERDRPAVWGATSDLMESWRFSRHPRLYLRRPHEGFDLMESLRFSRHPWLYPRRPHEGFDPCTVCGSPNKAIVRFCTFCGLEVGSSTGSIEAGRKLRQEEAQAESNVGAVTPPDDFDFDGDPDDDFDFDADADDDSASAPMEEPVM